MRNSSCVALLTCFAMVLQSLPAAALDLEKSFSGQSAGQAEYFNSNRDKRMLIQVNILSGVERPGIHQVPDTTNLLEALALAGGLTADADYGKVFLKRRTAANKTKYETLEYDITDLVRDRDEAYPTLQNYDTILIDPRPKTDQKLLTGLTIIASLVGIVSGALLIKKISKD